VAGTTAAGLGEGSPFRATYGIFAPLALGKVSEPCGRKCQQQALEPAATSTSPSPRWGGVQRSSVLSTFEAVWLVQC